MLATGKVRFVGEPVAAVVATSRYASRARHMSDLDPRPETFLSLDHAQRGLGTASCGPDTAERHRLLESSYRFSYVLRRL